MIGASIFFHVIWGAERPTTIFKRREFIVELGEERTDERGSVIFDNCISLYATISNQYPVCAVLMFPLSVRDASCVASGIYSATLLPHE